MGMEIVYTCSTYVTWLYIYIEILVQGTTIFRTLEGLVGLSSNFIPAPNPSQFNSPQDPWVVKQHGFSKIRKITT